MRIILVLLAFIGALAPAARGATPVESRKEPLLAVMDIINNTGEFAAFVDGMPDMLITELMETGEIKLVERTKVQTAMKALKLETSGLTEERNIELGKWLGVDGILFGAFNKVGEKYRLDVRAIDVQTGKIKVAASATCGKANVLDLITDIGGQLRTKLVRASGPPGAVSAAPPAPARAAASAPAKPPADSATLDIQYKMVVGLFAESAVPIQRVRIYLDNRLLGVSGVVNELNRYTSLYQGKVPLGEHTLVLVHGSVDKHGRWLRELEEQPEPLHLRIHKDDRAVVQYKVHAHDAWLSFQDFQTTYR
jgi:TolB-like protein